mgnify:CR=1 FL=1
MSTGTNQPAESRGFGKSGFSDSTVNDNINRPDQMDDANNPMNKALYDTVYIDENPYALKSLIQEDGNTNGSTTQHYNKPNRNSATAYYSTTAVFAEKPCLRFIAHALRNIRRLDVSHQIKKHA